MCKKFKDTECELWIAPIGGFKKKKTGVLSVPVNNIVLFTKNTHERRITCVNLRVTILSRKCCV